MDVINLDFMKQNTLLMKIVLLIAFFLQMGSSLSMVHSQEIQAVNSEAQQAYLDSLIEFEKKLEEKLKLLEDVAQATLDDANTMWEKDSLKRVVYEYGLNEERNIFLQIRKDENGLLDAQAYDCRNLTQEEIDKLQAYSDALKGIQEKQTDFYGNCTRENQLRFLASNIKFSAESIEKKLNNVCDPPKVILPEKQVTNFQVISNYILDGKALEDYKTETDALSDQFVLQTCPEDTPVVVQDSCQICQGFYKISSQQCLEQCPENTHYDGQQFECVDNFKVLNLEGSAGNYIFGQKSEQEINESIKLLLSDPSKTTTCPSENPFVDNSGECIACGENQIFDLSLNQCTTCPEFTALNIQEHVCKELGPVPFDANEDQCVGSEYKWNGTVCVRCEDPGYFEGDTCICPDSYFYNDQRLACRPREEICPEKDSDKFYWNGSVCIKCNFPGVFIYETMTCNCQEGYTYNFERQACIFGNGTIIKVPNIAQSTNWIYGEQGEQGYKDIIKEIDSETTSEQCPKEAPYPNQQGICVTCGVGELYDLSSQACKKCPEGTIFNEEIHQCLTEWENNESKCPDQTPIWNGTSCIKCEEPGKLENNICQCPKDYHYNWESLECVKNLKKYIPNFTDKGWIYGSLDEKSLQEKTQNQADEYILEKCPVDTPFPSNSGDCINCPEDRIFDVSTGFCTVCPAGQELNSDTHTCIQIQQKKAQCPEAFPYYNGTTCIKCEDPGTFDEEKKQCVCPEKYRYNSDTQACERIPSLQQNTNQNALNYYGEKPAFDSFLKVCPAETPFFDGTESCIACEYPNYFNFLKNKCEVCENGLIFDIATRSCIDQQEETPEKFNSLLNDENKNYCCGNPTKDKKLQNCPPEKPFFNNAECVACKLPSYFDFATYKCENCDEGSTFSQIVKKCVQNKYLQTRTVSNLEEVQNYHGQAPKIDESYLKVNKCPKNSPFFDGSACVKCELPKYFDFNTLKCYSCKYRYKFDLEEKKCMPKKKTEGYKNNYLVGMNNFAQPVPAYDPLYETCEKEAPYFDGNQCIACILPSYFNMTSKACETCAENNYFNIINKDCEFSDQQFITNIKADNIYYNGNYQEVIKYYQAKKEGNPDLKDCPEDKPFYQVRQSQCIQCPDDSPLFDMKYNECIQCGSESYFSAEKHVCISTGKVAPTVERMIMNIF